MFIVRYLSPARLEELDRSAENTDLTTNNKRQAVAGFWHSSTHHGPVPWSSGMQAYNQRHDSRRRLSTTRALDMVGLCFRPRGHVPTYPCIFWNSFLAADVSDQSFSRAALQWDLHYTPPSGQFKKVQASGRIYKYIGHVTKIEYSLFTTLPLSG